MIEYRHHRDSDVWHFDPACPHWPRGDFDYEVRFKPPVTGELCPQCEKLAQGKRSQTPETIETPMG